MNRILIVKEYRESKKVSKGLNVLYFKDNDDYKYKCYSNIGRYLSIKTRNSQSLGYARGLLIKFNGRPTQEFKVYYDITANPVTSSHQTTIQPSAVDSNGIYYHTFTGIEDYNYYLGVMLNSGDEVQFIKAVYSYNVIENDNILQMDVHNSYDRNALSLPISTAEIKINSSVASLFGDEHAGIYLYANNILIGTYYINKLEKLSSTEYRVSMFDAIGYLDKQIQQSKLIDGTSEVYNILDTDITLFDVIYNTATEGLDFPKGIFQKNSTREYIKQLSCATHYTVVTDRTDEIFLNRAKRNYTIVADNVFLGGTIEDIQTTKSLAVTSYEAVENENGNIQIGNTRYILNETITDAISSTETNGNESSITSAYLINPTTQQTLTNVLFNSLTLYKNKLKATVEWSGERLGSQIVIYSEFGTKTGILTDYVLRASQNLVVADITIEI